MQRIGCRLGQTRRPGRCRCRNAGHSSAEIGSIPSSAHRRVSLPGSVPLRYAKSIQAKRAVRARSRLILAENASGAVSESGPVLAHDRVARGGGMVTDSASSRQTDVPAHLAYSNTGMSDWIVCGLRSGVGSGEMKEAGSKKGITVDSDRAEANPSTVHLTGAGMPPSSARVLLLTLRTITRGGEEQPLCTVRLAQLRFHKTLTKCWCFGCLVRRAVDGPVAL
ncbi:hypothetical protein L1887_42613 [Cichorium endivia]|nr:hypothetical protein L1887_42613 [Cichorium endivia]